MLSCSLDIVLVSDTLALLLLDFGWDPIGRMKNKTPEQIEKLKNSELMNGRLAMWAIGGIATQSVLSGHDFPYI